MNKVTLDFLRSWINWVDAGAPDNGLYSRNQALCLAKFSFGDQDGIEEVDSDRIIGKDLKRMFKEDGLHWNYPFYDMKDANDSSGYRKDESNMTMHLNERRLAWVRSKLNV
jgi:hypothetical protein